jgi:hypothetical protein
MHETTTQISRPIKWKIYNNQETRTGNKKKYTYNIKSVWKYCISPLLRRIFTQKPPCIFIPIDNIVLNPKNALLVIGCVISVVAICEAGNTVIIRKLLWGCRHRMMTIVRKVLDSVSTNVLYAYTSDKLKRAGLISSNMYCLSSNQCTSRTACRQ